MARRPSNRAIRTLGQVEIRGSRTGQGGRVGGAHGQLAALALTLVRGRRTLTIMGMSARLLGYQLGKTAQQMNALLREHGYLTGLPGAYELTDKGAAFAKIDWDSNGYGGSHNATWSIRRWDPSVLESLAVDIANASSTSQPAATASAVTAAAPSVTAPGVTGRVRIPERGWWLGAGVLVVIGVAATPQVRFWANKTIRPQVARVRHALSPAATERNVVPEDSAETQPPA